MIGRRLVPWACLLALACGGTAPRGSVLLVTVDTLRPDHLSAYGYVRPTSPHVDALAARGLLFERVRSHAPTTAPSHATILTGRLPAWHRLIMNGDVLDDGATTLAEILGAAGLRTAAFVSNPTITSVENFQQGFEHFDDRLGGREAVRDMPERVAAATIDAALAWLAEHHREPFFCWVHLEDPHGPYVPPAEHAAAFVDEARALPPEPLAVLDVDQGAGGIPAYQALPGETNAHLYVARYDGEIHYVDAELGRLFERLAAWGAAPLVVFTADHGEALGEHGYHFAHGQDVTEDQLRVPLVLAGPGVPVGRRADPVQLADIVPTVLAWEGLPVPGDLPGRDLLGAPGEPRPAIALAFPFAWSVTLDGHKLVSRYDGVALYDLAEDPGETRDASGTAPAVRERLAGILQAEQARPTASWKRRPLRDRDLRERLKALGYATD